MTGLILGFKHALEADHVAAVISLRSRLGGLWWGMGHTLVLLAAGVAILVFKISIPARLNSGFEIAVGAILIVLGVNLIRQHHTHDYRTSTLIQPRNLFFVGILHGFAGSGAFVVLLSSLVGTLAQGIIFITIFGLGTVAGMTLVIAAYTFIHSRSLGKADKILNLATGAASIVLGIITVINAH